ncbi:MAG: MoxR family ATPase [Coriobacteriia bacterium]|nr:MoxR family ATPase [Coriobacteriia bacterium]
MSESSNVDKTRGVSESSGADRVSGVDKTSNANESGDVRKASGANRLSDTQLANAAACIKKIVDNIETVIIGKREVVELVVLSLVSGGHVLIEDVPGVGKTSLVSAMARSISGAFKRIQFTPDVMPSDVTGFSIFNQKTREFEFRPGAVISNIVLADEINRASAKTQSSLLEAMEEQQVTVDGHTYRLPRPFMVLATQNPLESFGTYPLPEAQIDRFLIKISIGYPSFGQEVRVVDLGEKAKIALGAVADAEDVAKLIDDKEGVFVAPMLLSYLVQLVAATRNHPDIQVGSSPRGSIALYNLARSYALYHGRSYVIPDDVKYLAPFALSHRLILTHEARLSNKTNQQVVASILDSVAVPVVEPAGAGANVGANTGTKPVVGAGANTGTSAGANK